MSDPINEGPLFQDTNPKLAAIIERQGLEVAGKLTEYIDELREAGGHRTEIVSAMAHLAAITFGGGYTAMTDDIPKGYTLNPGRFASMFAQDVLLRFLSSLSDEPARRH